MNRFNGLLFIQDSGMAEYEELHCKSHRETVETVSFIRAVFDHRAKARCD